MCTVNALFVVVLPDEIGIHTACGGDHTVGFLHGGNVGFDRKFWDVTPIEGICEDSLILKYTSPDGEEGYPGTLKVMVTYTFTDDNELVIHYEAVSDKDTLCNLTNHTYFNLAGEHSGSVLGHTLQLKASKWLPADKALIFTGEIAPVEGTPMDFRTAKTLGRDIEADFEPLKNARGYDASWVVDGWKKGELQQVGTLADPVSGRVMEIHTTQPALQLYTGNWLAGSPEGKSGRGYEDHEGVAIECQGYPDSVNHPEFVPARLEGGELYSEKIIYKFSTLS